MNGNNTLSQYLQKWTEHTIHQSMHGFMHFMRENELSYSQISVLYRIYHHGPTDIVSLSRELQISKAGAGQLIDRMIQTGWLNSQPSPTDKRSKMITLTQSGRDLVLSSQSASTRWIDEVLSQVPIENKQELTNSITSLISILSLDKHHTD
jgi:DNA-binding MarR family transcriptional regulator